MNRPVRDPYAGWCERRTSSEKSGEAVYSIVCSATRLPESFYEYNGDELMSNFDREIDKKTEEAIKGKDLFSRYAGWSFNGIVWWQDDKWLCEVWCYGSWRETFVCNSTEDILEEVSSEYGYD